MSCKPRRYFATRWIAGIGGTIAVGAFLLVLIAAAAYAGKQGNTIPKSRVQRPAAVKPLADEVKPACQFQPDAGPEMVVIASGEFMQGSPDNEPGRANNESPRHQVTISKPFSIGRCEVTVGEFRRFVEETGYNTDAEQSGGCFVWKKDAIVGEQNPNYFWDNPGLEQTERHPVTCLSWNDANAYIQWLNDYLRLSENTYRLPNESEWEYAVRAGTETTYYWDSDSQCEYANGADETMKTSKQFDSAGFYADCDDKHIYSAPVGNFKPNAWDLYDMSGNVWEWVEDCWHENYGGAPEDGGAWLGSYMVRPVLQEKICS